MITENGSIKVSTQVDEKVQKEFSKNTFLSGLVLTIIGAIGVVVSLVFEIVSIFLEIDDMAFFGFMILFAVFLGCGIGLLVLWNKAVSAARSSNKICTVEFFKDYFVVTNIANGETVGTAKFYNGQVIKLRETKNYIFLYANAANAFPVLKTELSEDEKNTIKSLFRLPVKGNTIELSAEVLPQADGVQAAENNDLDPFDEFNGKGEV